MHCRCRFNSTSQSIYSTPSHHLPFLKPIKSHLSLLPYTIPPRRLFKKTPTNPCSASASSSPQPDITLKTSLTAGSITKTALLKYPIADLRNVAQELGISTEGLLKADIVAALLSHTSTFVNNKEEEQEKSGVDTKNEAEPSTPTKNTPTSTTLSPPTTTPSNTPVTGNQSLEDLLYQTFASHTPSRFFHPKPIDHLSVTWLGTSSGNPSKRRNVSGIATQVDDDIILVDCGEGTRNQMRTFGINPAKITHFFITHMHGDHCFGIPGMIAEMCKARLGTSLQHEPIVICGPPAVQRQLYAACKAAFLQLTTPVHVYGFVLDPLLKQKLTPVDDIPGNNMLSFGRIPPDLVTDNSPARKAQAEFNNGGDRVVVSGYTWTCPVPLPGGLRVTAAQLQHRMPCWGYVLEEAPQIYDAERDNWINVGGILHHPYNRDYKDIDRFDSDSNNIIINNNNSDDEDVDMCGYGFNYREYDRRLRLMASVLLGKEEGEEEGRQRRQQEEEEHEAGSSSNSSDINAINTISSHNSFSELEGIPCRRGRKLVLLGDTCNSVSLARLGYNADVLSHEATYNADMVAKAQLATHSTTAQAGEFAGRINAKSLVLTHFSARYDISTAKLLLNSQSPININKNNNNNNAPASESFMSANDYAGAKNKAKREWDILMEEAKAGGAKYAVLTATDGFQRRVHPHSPLSAGEVFGWLHKNNKALFSDATKAYRLTTVGGGGGGDDGGERDRERERDGGYRSDGGNNKSRERREGFTMNRRGGGGGGGRGGYNNNRERRDQQYGGGGGYNRSSSSPGGGGGGGRGVYMEKRRGGNTERERFREEGGGERCFDRD